MLQTPARWLTRSAIHGPNTTPLRHVQSPTASSHPGQTIGGRRTVFGLGRRKTPDEETPENPVYDAVANFKPETKTPTLVRGGLADTSILEKEDPLPPTRKGQAPRDPHVTAAVLDPQPDVRRRWERKMVIRDIRKRGRLTHTETLKRTEREHLLKSHMLKTSIKKLGPLARQIAGKTVEDALVQMRFSKKLAAKDVKTHLEHARNEAIVRRGMGLGVNPDEPVTAKEIVTKEGKRRVVKDPTELYIDQAWVGRGPFGFQMEHRARGKIEIQRPPHTSLSVVLKEEATRVRLHDEREQKRRQRKLWVPLPNRPITTQRPYYSW